MAQTEPAAKNYDLARKVRCNETPKTPTCTVVKAFMHVKTMHRTVGGGVSISDW